MADVSKPTTPIDRAERQRFPLSLLTFLENRSELFHVLLGMALIGVIGLADYLSGPDLSFSLFYLFPVLIATWCSEFKIGVIHAALSTIVWQVVDTLSRTAVHPGVIVWNVTVRLGVFLVAAGLLAKLQQALRREHALARLDALTGAANGRTFYELAEGELRRMRRRRLPLTVAYIDLDNFKLVNDRSGHAMGDELLRRVVQVMQKNTRETNLVARLGGDEFVVLLPETDTQGANVALARLHQALLKSMAERNWPVTFSIGAATFRKPPVDVETMVRRADTLMYAAKHSGKNRIWHEVVEDAA